MSDIYLLIASIEYRTDRSRFFDSKKADEALVTDYRKLAFERIKQIEKRSPGAKKYVLVDILRGEISETEARQNIPSSFTVVDDTFERADRQKHYPLVYFEDNQEALTKAHIPQVSGFPKLIGATDIYDLIMTWGHSARGRLKEVSIFGHGFYGGPVFVNTYKGLRWQGDEQEVRKKKHGKIIPIPSVSRIDSIRDSDLRDPFDKDMRAEDLDPDFRTLKEIGNGPRRKHFAKDEMETFNRAFAADSIWWIWGCVADFAAQAAFFAMIKVGLHDAKKKNRFQPNTVVKLRIKTKHFTSLKTDYTAPPFAALKRMSRPKGATFTVPATVKECTDFMKMEMESTYAFRISLELKADVVAAAPGGWSGFSKTNKNMAHVPSVNRVLNVLFANHFNVSEDSEKRGFLNYSGP